MAFCLPFISVDALVVTADGKRFLVAVPFRQSGPQQITMVLNAQTGLKK